MTLARALAQPAKALAFDLSTWESVLCIAHAERLLPTLACRLEGLAVPERVRGVLIGARLNAEAGRVRALWEIEMARRALEPLGIPIVLLKGSAFIAAGMAAGQGRLVGDLDILVSRGRLDDVEAAILAAGWEWLKSDAYDDLYYRKWMHELPPLIHRDRDAMIDIHHTILPLTARPKPHAAAMIADSVEIAPGLRMLCPEDMIIHAAAHLFADGDLSGGLRNLWDIRCLLNEHPDADVRKRAKFHGLLKETNRALRIVDHVFGEVQTAHVVDRLYVKRLNARDGWGCETHKFLRFAFYVRSHLIRMPLPQLLRHLFTKWRRARGGA